jgi:type I restriction enzyme S subunit
MPERYTSVTNLMAEKNDVLFSVPAPVGRINVANELLVVGRGLAAIRTSAGTLGSSTSDERQVYRRGR